MPQTTTLHRAGASRHPASATTRPRPGALRALAVAALALGLTVGADLPAQGGHEVGHWVGTWASSPSDPGAPFADQTLRQIAYVSIGGERLRVPGRCPGRCRSCKFGKFA